MTFADVRVAAHGTDVLVTLSGEIDLTNREEVADAINAAVTNQTTDVRLDLSDVDYLDSTALRLLFTLADRLRLLQVGLTLLVPEDAVTRRVLALSALDQLVEVRPPGG
jgi:anti-anti-sigma factor